MRARELRAPAHAPAERWRFQQLKVGKIFGDLLLGYISTLNVINAAGQPPALPVVMKLSYKVHVKLLSCRLSTAL